jgi:ring-1,2-phenylacetyl-CoA epoxidase subunit PaaA
MSVAPASTQELPTRKYAARQFEAGDPLPSDDYYKLLVKLVLDTGEAGPPEWLDVLVETFQRMLTLAPDVASKLRAADYLADELRHCMLFDGILHGLGLEPQAEGLTSLELLHVMTRSSSWPEYCMLNALGDRAASFQIADYVNSSYAPLARVCKSVARDERGHCVMGDLHLRALCEGPTGRSEAQELLATWYPQALDMFGRSESGRQYRFIEYGLKETPNQVMRERYLADLNPLLESCGLEPPDPLANRHIL